jgi:hypothetical protein
MYANTRQRFTWCLKPDEPTNHLSAHLRRRTNEDRLRSPAKKSFQPWGLQNDTDRSTSPAIDTDRYCFRQSQSPNRTTGISHLSVESGRVHHEVNCYAPSSEPESSRCRCCRRRNGLCRNGSGAVSGLQPTHAATHPVDGGGTKRPQYRPDWRDRSQSRNCEDRSSIRDRTTGPDTKCQGYPNDLHRVSVGQTGHGSLPCPKLPERNDCRRARADRCNHPALSTVVSALMRSGRRPPFNNDAGVWAGVTAGARRVRCKALR